MPLPSCHTTQVCSGFAASSVACLLVVAAVSIVVGFAGPFAGSAAGLLVAAVVSFAGLWVGFGRDRVAGFVDGFPVATAPIVVPFARPFARPLAGFGRPLGGLFASFDSLAFGRLPCRFVGRSLLRHCAVSVIANGLHLRFRVTTRCTIITPRVVGTMRKAQPKSSFSDSDAGYAEKAGRWGCVRHFRPAGSHAATLALRVPQVAPDPSLFSQVKRISESGQTSASPPTYHASNRIGVVAHAPMAATSFFASMGLAM